MLDRKFILENAALVKQNCINRGVKVDVDRFVELEAKRKKLQAEVEELNRQARAQTDLAAAVQMQDAKRKLFAGFHQRRSA